MNAPLQIGLDRVLRARFPDQPYDGYSFSKVFKPGELDVAELDRELAASSLGAYSGIAGQLHILAMLDAVGEWTLVELRIGVLTASIADPSALFDYGGHERYVAIGDAGLIASVQGQPAAAQPVLPGFIYLVGGKTRIAPPPLYPGTRYRAAAIGPVDVLL